jgi:hypothetical protein
MQDKQGMVEEAGNHNKQGKVKSQENEEEQYVRPFT